MDPLIVISHRGNLNGPDPKKENSIEYISDALKFHPDLYVEIDLWKIGNKIFLGHDYPQYETTLVELLKWKQRLICHAKTPATLVLLLGANFHTFFHKTDEVVLTSENWLWTYPSGEILPQSIWVLPERVVDLSKPIKLKYRGVCTDYPLRFLKEL